MVIGGMRGDDAIHAIRTKRKPPSRCMPLFNQHFVKLIMSIDKQLHEAVSTQTP